MPRELYQAGTNPEAEKLAKELGISLLEAVRILNTMEDTSFMQKGFIEDRPDMNMGGIANLAMRRQYGLGGFVKSITKGIKGAVSGALDTAKDFAKSDIGQIALAYAIPYSLGPSGFLGGTSFGKAFTGLGSQGFLGNALRSGITNLALQGITTGKVDLGQAGKAGLVGGAIQTGFQKLGEAPVGKDSVSGDVTTGSTVVDSAVAPEADVFVGDEFVVPSAAATTAADASQGIMDIDSYFGGPEFTNQVPVTPSVSTQTPVEGFSDYYASETIAGPEQAMSFTKEAPTAIRAFDAEPLSETLLQEAEGGLRRPIGQRIQNIARTGIQKVKDVSASTFLKDPSQGVNLKNLDLGNIAKASIIPLSLLSALSVPKQPEETDFDYESRLNLVKKFEDKYSGLAGVSTPDTITDYEDFFSERARVAIGGLPDVPMGEPRQNKGGVTEIDYRDTGGFVPIGIKEKADDVPAMLSKNEFVFTADAVKNAGNGDVEKGAERLYKTMKILENGGTV